MLARRQHAEVGDVRRAEAVVRGKFLVVHPDGALPVRAFQKKREMAAQPVGGNFNVALIPRRAEIMLRRLGKKRHFHVARLGKMFAQARAAGFSTTHRQA